MCNCTSSIVNVCQQCSQGNPCGCPPDYAILPQPVPCVCCPPGYTYNEISKQCEGGGGTVRPIPCSPCANSVPADCVILPAVECLGIQAGTTLTQFVNYLCSIAFIETILTKIGLNNTTLGVDFCELVQACPPSSSNSTTPIIVYVTFSAP